MISMMTNVKGHYMSTRGGKETWVKSHKMEINPAIHERHEERLEKEIEALEKQRMKA